jgi:hypothetical protein
MFRRGAREASRAGPPRLTAAGRQAPTVVRAGAARPRARRRCPRPPAGTARTTRCSAPSPSSSSPLSARRAARRHKAHHPPSARARRRATSRPHRRPEKKVPRQRGLALPSRARLGVSAQQGRRRGRRWRSHGDGQEASLQLRQRRRRRRWQPRATAAEGTRRTPPRRLWRRCSRSRGSGLRWTTRGTAQARRAARACGTLRSSRRARAARRWASSTRCLRVPLPLIPSTSPPSPLFLLAPLARSPPCRAPAPRAAR